MSYLTVHDPVLTGQIRTPVDDIAKMPLNDRKVIARRAAMMLQPGKFVNLGIGVPDGVASVAGEEDLLDCITLTTEPGVVGGIPATGHEFGPASNPDSQVEMNQIFDYYNGAGLEICFLGAAEISPAGTFLFFCLLYRTICLDILRTHALGIRFLVADTGDVNVSRMNKDNLTGPGGFIDITNATPTICFMGTFTARGLKIDLPDDGTIKIKTEGKVQKYRNEIFEKTFSADQAMLNGQKVYYVTERAVFQRTSDHDILELVEIAPGVDLEKDILAHMEFKPVISPDLKLMDSRIFKDEKMNIRDDVFGSLEDRATYKAEDHSVYLDLFGVSLQSAEDIKKFFGSLEKIFSRYAEGGKNKFHAYLNYDGFDVRSGLEETYGEYALDMQTKYFASVKRFAGKAFRRAKLGTKIRISRQDPHEIFNELDTNRDGYVSAQTIRDGVLELLNIRLSQQEVNAFLDDETEGTGNVSEEKFVATLSKFLKSKGFHLDHNLDHLDD